MQPRKLDARAFNLARQRDRLAEQARGFVGAAGQFAREHGLGLGEAGPHHQLGGGENLGVGFGVVALLQQQIDIGTKHVGEARRQVAGVALRMDDVAEHGFRGCQLAAAGEIAREPRFRVQQHGGAGVIGLQQRDRLAVQPVGLGVVAGILGNGAEIAEDLRAHPQN